MMSPLRGSMTTTAPRVSYWAAASGLFGGLLYVEIDGQINIVARLVGIFNVFALAVIEIVDKHRLLAGLAAQLLVIDPFDAASSLEIRQGEGDVARYRFIAALNIANKVRGNCAVRVETNGLSLKFQAVCPDNCSENFATCRMLRFGTNWNGT